MPPIPAQQTASQQSISRQLQHTSIPKRFSLPMREIWDLQQHLPKRRGKRAFQTLEHKRFRAAYDFLLLRETAGEIEPGLGDWWTAFQDGDEHEQARLIAKTGGHPAGTSDRPKRRPRRRRRRNSNAGQPNDGRDE